MLEDIISLSEVNAIADEPQTNISLASQHIPFDLRNPSDLVDNAEVFVPEVVEDLKDRVEIAIESPEGTKERPTVTVAPKIIIEVAGVGKYNERYR